MRPLVPCRVCGRFIQPKPKGPVPQFCSAACRQRNHRDQATTSDSQILRRIRGLHKVGSQLLDGNDDYVMYWWDTADDLLDYILTGRQ